MTKSKKKNAPSVSHMNKVEYVQARWAEIPDQVKALLRGDNDQNLLELQRVFEKEYDRERMLLLEGNCHGFVRHYLAAMNALMRKVSSEEAALLLVEELDKLPDKIEEIPDL